MNYMDILEKFAIYSKYDKEQTRFNLLSNNYKLHVVGETIEKLLSDYDNTGMLAVIYAKIQFEKLLKDTKIRVWDVLSNPDSCKEERVMFEAFNNPTVTKAENEFINKLNQIYLRITNGKLLGEDREQREQLLNSIEQTIKSIGKCHVELFLKGGEIKSIQNISTKLHVFNTLAECLLSIEKAQDGIYLCFIAAGNSADCFFGFFVKSNGTILSVNDKIDERYIGQHGHLRNARWTEDKVDDIFPYDYIFRYAKHDYKGYATEYVLDENKMDLYNLGIEVFMPIVVAMLLILLKFTNKPINLPLHYLDSFLPENQAKIESNGLMVIEESALVAGHDAISLDFDNAKILSGEYAEEFDPQEKKNGDYRERGYFKNNNQLMVDLWGEGFVFDPTAIFQSNNISCLMDKAANIYIPEFVATEKRLRLQVYKEAREQLAKYIKGKIHEAWVAYGKTEAVKKWYENAVLANKDAIYQMLMEYEDAIENENERPLTPGWCKKDGSINIYITKNKSYPSNVLRPNVINAERPHPREWKWICSVNGCTCNTWFVIKPQTWEHLELLTGQEVPKIVKGWKANGRDDYGNPLLDVTDAVETVGTPFERGFEEEGAKYDFSIILGFSKRGWAAIKKQLKEKS